MGTNAFSGCPEKEGTDERGTRDGKRLGGHAVEMGKLFDSFDSRFKVKGGGGGGYCSLRQG